MSGLTPLPFPVLAARMFEELEKHNAIFELPSAYFYTGGNSLDLSVAFHGRRVATPFGPAAGPHTQLAQNLVLAFLAGARILELKTVQILDTLTLPRPCIDMRTIGYNAEWSQELTLEQSLEEYVKASMLIELLVASGKLKLRPEDATFCFDMSVGYDLKGITSPRVQTFIQGLRDASSMVDRFRAELPPSLRMLREVPFRTQISDTLTLSTFHGCPPEEIEAIMVHLLEDLGLNSIVKLNPTLLGQETVHQIMADVLGYTEQVTPATAFQKDTRWEQAVGFITRLKARAAARGLGFGVKCTNTLIVENRTSNLPKSEHEVYLSGPPLHVLAIQLVQKLRDQFGPELPISFSAGVDKGNFAECATLGLTPITVCSDLLKTGGYRRARGYFQALAEHCSSLGAGSLSELCLKSAQQTQGAVASVSEALMVNTRRYAQAVLADPRYGQAQNARPPRKVGSHLVLFDCLTCDKCLHVCPNAAIYDVPSPELSLKKSRQIIIQGELCNECGNCDVFCPEDGGPYLEKPVVYRSQEAFEHAAPRPAFCFVQEGGEELWLQRTPEGTVGFRIVASQQVERLGASVRITIAREALDRGGAWISPALLSSWRLLGGLREALLKDSRVQWMSVESSSTQA